MSKKWSTTWWVLAGVAAVALSFLTFRLARLSDSETALIGEEVYINGKTTLVMLRETPLGSARVRAVVERGATATIIEMQTGNQQNWFWIETEIGSGWVGSSNLSLDPP